MRNPPRRAKIGKRLWLLLLFPAALLLHFCAAEISGFAEWYATGIYPVFSRAVNRLTGLVPFSVAELAVFAFALFFAAALIRLAVRLIRGKGRRAAAAVKFFVNLAVLVSVAAFWFTAACGVNYSRLTFAQTGGLEIKPSSKAELKKLCSSLAADLGGLRPGLATDARSVMKLRAGSLDETARKAARYYDGMERDYPLLKSGYGAPKPVLFSRLMSRCGVTGVFFPFTFEANVNTDVPEYTLPATMCHELSHLRGYMREDEANFLGYLVCKKSGDPDFMYSGDMLAFTCANNALYSADAEAAGRIYASLDEGVRRDLSFNAAYWKRFEGPVSRASNRLNDRYLKANRQEDGVKSYGRMVDLLLAEQRAERKE